MPNMADKIHLEYRLTGVGWAECRLTMGQVQAVATASYFSDALGDFARAVVDIIDGKRSAKFQFAEEPGEYEWKLQRQRDNLRCVLKWFPDGGTPLASNRSKTRLDITLPMVDFIRAVDTMLSDVLATYGLDGYWEQWVEHGFPLSSHERIRAYVAAID